MDSAFISRFIVLYYFQTIASITCSKLTVVTLEQGVKYVQSYSD